MKLTKITHLSEHIKAKLGDIYLSNLNWIIFCLIAFCASRFLIYLQAHIINDINSFGFSRDFTKLFLKWDSAWYLSIIQHGYAEGPIDTYTNQQNWAFFPLYPVLVKLLSQVFTWPSVNVGYMVSNLCLLSALLCFYQLLRRYFDEANSRFGVILLAFSPYNIYFASMYTESLFLFLSLACLLLAYSNRWFLMSLVGALLSAARPNGVLIVLPLLYIFYSHWHEQKVPLYKILYFTIIPFGLIAYMTYLYYHTGDALAFYHIQQAWGRSGWHWGWENILRTIGLFVGRTYNFIVFVISLWLIIYTYRKKYFTEVFYYFAMIFPAVASGDPHSLARYSASIYTFYFGLVIFCRRDRLRKIVILSAVLVCLSLFSIAWIRGYGALT